MSDQNSDEVAAARADLVRYSARLLGDGLAIGSAGNLSVRAAGAVAITPSGVPYADIRPADICLVDPAEDLAARATHGPGAPSSETPMHLAIYAATGAGAVVHTHSPEVVALSASRAGLPAIHYAVT
jgi:L-fuculose-phosphate aldolase